MCFDMFFFYEIFIGKRKRRRLVSWVECITRLLEINEGERNHEFLLSMKNLWELGANPFPYIVPVIPHQLPAELVKGEHFTLFNILKSIPSSTAQAGSTQVEITKRSLVIFVRLNQSPLAKQDS